MKSDVIDKVEEIRKNNNTLWMDILRIAYQAAPQAVRIIMKEIGENDKQVTKWLKKL